jgi:hypothetical protein
MECLLTKSVKTAIQIEFAVVLGWVKARWEAWEEGALGEFIVTSLNDNHDSGQHPKGEAADVRTRHLFKDGKHADTLIRFAKFLQSHGLRVVVHPDWVAGTPHLHFALGKKPIFRRVA